LGKIATSEQIRDFLKRFKQAAGEHGKWWLVNRRVNLEGLASLGIAVPEVKRTVLALTKAELSPALKPTTTEVPARSGHLKLII
jgi:hypothetical protein